MTVEGESMCCPLGWHRLTNALLFACMSISLLATRPSATPTPNSKGTSKQHFTFDRVIGPDDGQTTVYSSIEPLIARFLEGYNVTVLAYGQTSSGKSYTMGTDVGPSHAHHGGEEDGERLGIIPRSVAQIFDELNNQVDAMPGKVKYDARNSYIEIYSA